MGSQDSQKVLYEHFPNLCGKLQDLFVFGFLFGVFGFTLLTVCFELGGGYCSSFVFRVALCGRVVLA